MPQVFPVPPAFPALNWTDNMVPGDAAVIVQTFANKSVSRLRISELQSDAEFTASWNDLTYDQVQVFLNFWKLVGTWEAFSLPAGFWHPSMNTVKRDTLISLSPTGLWMFKEVPKFYDYNLEQQAIEATLKGTID
jgi:hypothetical protein